MNKNRNNNISFYRKDLNTVFINDYVLRLLKSFSKIETPVSINISSNIRNCKFIIHDEDITGKRNYSQDPQRLTGRGGIKCPHVIVRTISKVMEGGITRLPACKTNSNSFRAIKALVKQVTKVTECRQTEDQLTRDMLASTAAQINCVSGTNGKIVAVLKSSLIDLELLAA